MCIPNNRIHFHASNISYLAHYKTRTAVAVQQNHVTPVLIKRNIPLTKLVLGHNPNPLHKRPMSSTITLGACISLSSSVWKSILYYVLADLSLSSFISNLKSYLCMKRIKEYLICVARFLFSFFHIVYCYFIVRKPISCNVR